MLVAFKLSMPSIGSWNGQWSGSERLYARVRNLDKESAESIIGKDFFYRWNDGWTACVSAERVLSKEAERIRKASKGFYGYDWMIDSILKIGRIETDCDEKARK